MRATAGKPDLPDPPAFAPAHWLSRATAAKPDRPDLSDLPVRLLTDLVLLQLLVQVAAGRADHFRSLRDVPAVFAELADQKHALGVLLELAQRPQLRRVAVEGRRRALPAAR